MLKRWLAACAAVLSILVCSAAVAARVPEQEIVPMAFPKTAEVTNLQLVQKVDGTEAFDADDAAGHDSSASNGILRTLDSVTYHLRATIQEPLDPVRDAVDDKVYIRALLPGVDRTQAFYLTEEMQWLKDATVTDTAEGLQLTGYMTLDSDDRSVYWADFAIGVKVYRMNNGERIAPQFTAWLAGQQTPAAVAEDTSVTVSACNALNVTLDFSDEMYQDVFTIDGRKRSGRMTGLKVSVQLISEHDGLKGVAFPEGPITFDIDLKMLRKMSSSASAEVTDVTQTNMPTLWDYHQMFDGQQAVGYLGKQIPERFVLTELPLGKLAAGMEKCSIYDSGSLTVTQEGSTLHVVMDDYRFSPDGIFPWLTLNGDIIRSNVGFFTQGYLQVFMPYDTTSVSSVRLFTAQASLSNLKLDGRPCSQVMASDDAATYTSQIVYGGIHQSLRYLSQDQYTYDAEKLWMPIGVTIKCYNDSSFMAYPGQRLYMQGAAGTNIDGSYSSMKITGLDFLIKLPKDIVLDGTLRDILVQHTVYPERYASDTMQYMLVQDDPFTWKRFYAVKADGSAWASEAEMDAAQAEDLMMYEDLAQVPQGAQVVGVYMEGRGPQTDSPWFYFFTLPVQLSEDAQVGYVYPAMLETTMYEYRSPMLAQEGARYPRSQAGMDHAIWKARYDLTRYSSVLGRNGYKITYGRYAYYKTAYQNGQVVPNTHLAQSNYGYSAGNFGGISLLAIGMAANVEKVVAQTDAQGNPCAVFDLSSGQSRVDFRLTPSYRFLGSYSEPGRRDTLAVIDIPDIGLSYVAGSAVQGGVYDPATQTVTGGVPIEPVIGTDSAGRQVLQWMLSDVEAGQPIPPIYYACTIAPDTPNGTLLTNAAYVLVPTDPRDLSENNGNLAFASFHVVKNGSSSFTKLVDKTTAELGDTLTYTVSLVNRGDAQGDDVVLRDVLPYDGDANGTQLKGGSYIVESVSVEGGTDVALYMTADAAVRTQPVQDADLSAWTPLTAQSGTARVDKPLGDVVALACKADVAVGQTLTMRVQLRLVDSACGAVLVNKADASAAQYPSLRTLGASTRLVGRSIDGLVWIDANRNGQRDRSERLLSNVSVALLDARGNAATDVYGRTVEPVLTDADGSYEFRELTAGTYQLRIETHNTPAANLPLTDYRAMGVDESLNSDAVQIDEYAVIDNVQLPSLQQIDEAVDEYRLSNLDVGFIPHANLPQTGDRALPTAWVLCAVSALLSFIFAFRSYRGRRRN